MPTTKIEQNIFDLACEVGSIRDEDMPRIEDILKKMLKAIVGLAMKVEALERRDRPILDPEDFTQSLTKAKKRL